MKKLILLVLAHVWMITYALAYDFSAVTSSGQTLYYDILNSNDVSVTFPGSNQYEPYYGFLEPTGDLAIPSTVTNGGITYSVTLIDICTFFACQDLASVTIPASVTYIDIEAFCYCTGLTSIIIPNSVTFIGESAFSYCDGLNFIEVSSGNTVYDSRDNCNAIIETATNTLIRGCINTIIPNSVTSIGEFAFEGCSSLVSITIPDSVTRIDNYAFQNCSNLTSISIPDFVTYIGDNAFSGCNSLSSVAIPDSVIYIGAWAFSYCYSLTSVTIPNSVTYIGSYAFCNCSSLTSITLSNSLTFIDYCVFQECTNLSSVTIPNSVTSIGHWAFYSCTSLTSLTIGNSVTSIREEAFEWCSALSEIICLASEAPELEMGVFNYVPTSIPVYIPCESTLSYQSEWSYFNNFNEVFTYTLNVQSNDETMGNAYITEMPTDCSSPIAVIQAVANNEYHFTHWSTGSTDNPLTLTVTSDTTIIAYFEATSTGIDEAFDLNTKVYVNNGQIVVEGMEGEDVMLYDITGRILVTHHNVNNQLRFNVVDPGVYFVKIGNHPARKVAIM